MTEDLKGRVLEIHRKPFEHLIEYRCRAATLNGIAVDFTFTLDVMDERTSRLQRGSRVTYSAQGVGAWGSVMLQGDSFRIPADSLNYTKVPSVTGGPASFREAATFEAAPEISVRQRVEAEAQRMGYEVAFGVDDGRPYVEILVPGRGKMKHYKEAVCTWDEVLSDAGLGGTIG